MTTTTTNFDLSKLNAYDKGCQMMILTLTQTGDMQQAYKALADQMIEVQNAATPAGMKAIKQIKVEFSPDGSISGAIRKTSSILCEHVQVLGGMATVLNECLEMARTVP
jgi:hypothetical protein